MYGMKFAANGNGTLSLSLSVKSYTQKRET